MTRLKSKCSINEQMPNSREQFGASQNSWAFIFFYHSILWAGELYSLYSFYIFSQKYKEILNLTERDDLFGTHQDQNDLEWKIFLPTILQYAPYGILHLILAQVIRYCFPHLLNPFYIVFSSFMAVKIIGFWGMCLCYLIPIVMGLILLSRMKTLIWISWCLLLATFNFTFFEDFLDIIMSDQEEKYKTSVIIAWIMLRCVSYCLVTCDEDPSGRKTSISSFIDILGYSLYFPHLVTGPYVPYKDYAAGINKPFESWTLRKLLWFIGQCFRFFIWIWLADLLLYYFYAHALIFNPEYIRGFNSWTMAGYYSFLLIFFILKYVVLYGLPSVLARAEGFSPPDPPRCVIFVEKFSHIWKYFDIGLHHFMVDHIYVPFLGEDASFFRQVQGCVVAFTFVYVWHGAYPSAFWWCVVTFALTVVEKVAGILTRTQTYHDWKEKWLPGKLSVLFHRMITGFFFSLSTTSIIIFLSSAEHAQMMFRNIYVSGFPVVTVVTGFFFALLSQGSQDLLHFRRRKLKIS